MGKTHQLVTTTPTDVEIVMSRTFDAPRDLVFEAHSSCEHLSNWWGPRDSKFLECDVDFRVGGSWRVVVDNADTRYWTGPITFFGEYLEIVPPERLSWTFGFNDEPGGPETYVFEEHDGKTTVTSKAVFPTKEERDAALDTGMETGAAETYDRLDEYLEVLAANRTA
jgi:uncharacterized protein YndB with AHSA1/START domain